MPDLTSLPQITNGTDKQIAWATEIRAAYLRGFLARVPEAKHTAALADVGAKLTTDAGRWIETYKSLGDVLGKPGETTFAFGPRTQTAIAELAN